MDPGQTDLAVLDEPEDVFKAVVVEEHGLEDRSVSALQDLRHRSYKQQHRSSYSDRTGPDAVTGPGGDGLT